MRCYSKCFNVRFVVLNATFNNISVISWWSVLLLNETGVPGENHRSFTDKLYQIAYNNIIASEYDYCFTIICYDGRVYYLIWLLFHYYLLHGRVYYLIWLLYHYYLLRWPCILSNMTIVWLLSVTMAVYTI